MVLFFLSFPLKGFKPELVGFISSVLFLLGIPIVSLKAQQQPASKLKLWYEQPSGKTWENALPIGNGMLGAMVYGNVEKETLKLNEHTLWSGGPNRNDVPETFDSLNQIRQLIFEGKHKQAENLVLKVTTHLIQKASK